MKGLSFIGKLMIVVPMAFFGVGHLENANQMVGLVPDFLPFKIFWVYITGIALILAAVAIVLDRKAKLAAQLLGLMLVLFAVLVHFSSSLNSGDIGLMNFFKDIAIAGGIWFMSARLKN